MLSSWSKITKNVEVICTHVPRRLPPTTRWMRRPGRASHRTVSGDEGEERSMQSLLRAYDLRRVRY